MPLESTIADITARLRQSKFLNEQSISQGIVLRCLQELGSNTYDTSSVWPEYQTGEGRVDFALCHPPSKPAAFNGVKHPCKADQLETQLTASRTTMEKPMEALVSKLTTRFEKHIQSASLQVRSPAPVINLSGLRPLVEA